MARSSPHRVFVYGSLLSGLRYHYMMGDSRFLGVGLTRPRFTLHDLGAYPGITEGGATAIAGEIYEVDDARLAALDAFEDCPDMYERLLEPLAEGGTAWLYVLRAFDNLEHRPTVPSGSWRQWTTRDTLIR